MLKTENAHPDDTHEIVISHGTRKDVYSGVAAETEWGEETTVRITHADGTVDEESHASVRLESVVPIEDGDADWSRTILGS